MELWLTRLLLTPQERDTLIVSHMDYARRGALKHWWRTHRRHDAEDLCGVAYLALTRAGQHFQPERGWSFKTYAFKVVQGALWDFTREEMHRFGYVVTNTRPVACGEKWERQLVLVAPRREWPTDTGGHPRDFPNLLYDLEQAVARRELQALVMASAPNARTRAIFRWRLAGATAAAIADRLGISPQRVAQLEQRGIARARAFVAARGWRGWVEERV